MNPLVILFLALSVFSAGSVLYAKHEHSRANRLEIELDKANTTITEANRLQKLSEDTSNEHQKRLATLNRQLNAARLQPSKCIALTNTPASGFNAGTRAGQPMGSLVVNSAAIDELIAEGERYRSQLIGLQAFCKNR